MGKQPFWLKRLFGNDGSKDKSDASEAILSESYAATEPPDEDKARELAETEFSSASADFSSMSVETEYDPDAGSYPVAETLAEEAVPEPFITLPQSAINQVATPIVKEFDAIEAAEERVPSEWNIGDVILDLYEVKRAFTGGAMGLVYAVHHKDWDIDLIVKSPRPNYFLTEAHRQNFTTEAETWVNLGLHTHTVSCYYVRTLGGIPRVFAEYVEGGTLQDWIRSGTLYQGGIVVALDRMLDISIQFAWGLHYAHECGLVHQDVKPGNVLVTPTGVAKVTDFGLAKARHMTAETSESDAGMNLLASYAGMTPAYCSPEQANRLPLSLKTDIWSWGLSVLEIFAGEMFWAANALPGVNVGLLAPQALESYLAEGSAHKNIPPMPASLAELLARCFGQQPSARPKDMLEIARALAAIYESATGKLYVRQQPKASKAVADSLNNRAVSLLDLKRVGEAEHLWEEALKIHPHHPEATYNSGIVKWRSARTDSETLLRQLEEVRRTNKWSLLQLDNRRLLDKLWGDGVGHDFHKERWREDYLFGLASMEAGNYEVAVETLKPIFWANPEQKQIGTALEEAEKRSPHTTRLLCTFAGNRASVVAAALSPDGRYALSTDRDGTLRIWDSNEWDGEAGSTFLGGEQFNIGHTGEISTACFDRSANYLLTGGWSGDVILSEIETLRLGKPGRALEGHSNLITITALSPDGRYALTGDGANNLKLWEVESGRCLRALDSMRGEISAACLMTDGRRAVIGGWDSLIQLLDMKNGEVLLEWKAHENGVTALYLSEDERVCLSSGADNKLKLWDLRSAGCLREFEGHAKKITAVAMDAKQRIAISGSDDATVRVWEISTGRDRQVFTEHKQKLNSVYISADGLYVLSGSDDRQLKLWALDTQDPYNAPMVLCRVQQSENVLSAQMIFDRELAEARAAFSAGEVIQAARHIREARSKLEFSREPEAIEAWSELYVHLPRQTLLGVWEVANLEGETHNVKAIALSPDGRHAVAGGIGYTGVLSLSETKSGRLVKILKGHEAEFSSICFSHDGRYVLTSSGVASIMNDVTLWNVETGEHVLTFDDTTPGVEFRDTHDDKVTSVHFSPDSRHAISGSADKTIKLWEVETGRVVRTFNGHTDQISSVCYSPDGYHIVSASKDFTIRLWNTVTGECLSTLEGHLGGINSVCFSSDGRRVLSGSDDTTLRLWDIAEGRLLGSFVGHESKVNSVCLTFDGRYAVSASSDGTIKIWEVESGRALRSIEGHEGRVNSVCVSRDGRYILSAGSSRHQSVKLWFLEWELEERESEDWDESAIDYLKLFLEEHKPTKLMRKDRKPTDEEIRSMLKKSGRARWNDNDFNELLYRLGCAGLGRLKREAVRRKLLEMSMQ